MAKMIFPKFSKEAKQSKEYEQHTKAMSGKKSGFSGVPKGYETTQG